MRFLRHTSADRALSSSIVRGSGNGRSSTLSFAPEWTGELPGRDVVLKKVTGIDLKIGLGVAWSKDIRLRHAMT